MMPLYPGSELMKVIWVKSSLSFSNGNCVEVTDLPGGSVGVRHSRDPEGPVLRFTPGEWDAFLAGARLGEFDRFGARASAKGGDGQAAT
jgi:hypothetical protein